MALICFGSLVGGLVDGRVFLFSVLGWGMLLGGPMRVLQGISDDVPRLEKGQRCEVRCSFFLSPGPRHLTTIANHCSQYVKNTSKEKMGYVSHFR